MSKIPDYTVLKREILQVSGDVDIRGAGANIGAGLMGVAKAVAGYADRKNQNDFVKAQADMTTYLVGETSAYDQDPDYKTHHEKFSGNTKAKLSEFAAGIADANTRDRFIQTFEPKIALAGEKVKDVAWGKERSFERGEAATRLETLTHAAIISGGIGDANESANALIDSSVEMGYIDSDDAVKMKSSFRDSLSKRYIQSLEPEKRGDELKKVKKYLPPDIYAKLKRDADDELMIGQAQTQVDEYMSEDIDRDEVMSRIDKKYSNKPELREKIEKRYDYAKSKQDKAVVETQSELFDKYFLPVRSGESTVDKIPREDLEKMSPKQQNSLYNAQSTSVSKSKVSFNVSHEDNLNGLLQTKKFQDLRKYFVENAGEMSDSQNKSWSKVSLEGVIPADVKSLFSATASLESKTPNYSKERRGVLKDSLNNWYQDYQEENKQIPTDDLINKQTDRMIMEFGTTGWLWGSDPKPVFEMTEDDKNFVLKTAQEEDKKSYNDAGEYFKSRGIQPDHAQFMEAYTILRDGRRAK